MKKRGLSPVIATVLLIAIVVIIALIIFLWLRGITKEAITKFDGKNVQLVCEEVQFDAEYYGGRIYLSNSGNVPIYRMKARISSIGSYETVLVGEGDPGWPDEGLNPGGTYSGDLNVGGADEILLIPVLIGKTSSEEKKSYTCEDRQGKEIIVA